MSDTKKQETYIFKYSLMLRSMFWASIGISAAFLCFIFIWVIMEITGTFDSDSKALYVMFGTIGVVVAAYCSLIAAYFIIGAISRRNIDTRKLVNIIFKTKASKATIMYKNLLRCMYLITYRRKIIECLDISFEEEK
ncbi:hypothetical protein ACM0LK_03010 [Mycoplasma sp. Z331B]|uniref:hypothetical protein n=1 Tax=Mycoplasma sp. Z331B TaxID=3398775 RepID=UPI003A8449A0